MRLKTCSYRLIDLVLLSIAAPALVLLVIVLLVPQVWVFGHRVLFVQRRVAPDGSGLAYLKFRSMHDGTGFGRAQLESDRIPRWGRVLRRLHLDELPELALVAAGRMQLVGPRPLLPAHHRLVDSAARRTLRPGWTGYAQLYLARFGVLPSRVQRRLDARLADKLSPRGYLSLLLATGLHVAASRRRAATPQLSPTVRRYRSAVRASVRGGSLVLAIWIAAGFTHSAAAQSTAAPTPPGQSSAAADLTLLVDAYPGIFQVDLTPGAEALVLPDGTRLPYRDGRERSFEQRLRAPDLQDMLRIPYPAGAPIAAPPVNSDPGRMRPQRFFAALYGDTEAIIADRLRSVRWVDGQGTVQVTTRFGVDRALERVIAELEQLPQELRRTYLYPPGGGFNFRAIAGTDRLSPHAFGIAVDIRVATASYWRWDPAGAERYRNTIPAEIVAAFERHGFIWGGRWYHYDTMHFEYRPELLLKAARDN